MRKILTILVVLVMLLGMAGTAMATNGDNLIAVGPIARAMGGVGIAAPQDAISAVFSNPAGMCFGPYCPGSEFNFAGTVFLPRPQSRIVDFTGTTVTESDKKAYAIPAIGLSIPINDRWRFGLAAYGVSGLGVDYRDTNQTFFGQPTNLNTQLQIMKFAPNFAYQVSDQISLGLGIHVDYSSLDLGSGSSFGYGLGVQLGAIYKVTDRVSLGLTYRSPQGVDHENVANFNADLNGDGDSDDAGEDTTLDDLELEAPQEVGIGVAVEPIAGKLLVEFNGKWINWSDAAGYEDFDWDDQFVIAVGAQFKPTEKLALRVGYNYGANPVKVHNNFDGASVTMVQGVPTSTLNYEFLRIIGFPAIVEHHVTAGIGYEFSDSFAVNVAYMHAFEETITETTSTNVPSPTTLESTLSEDSIEFGLTWRF